jgi:hypothetical protein
MSSPFLHPCHWYREMAQGRGIDASLSSAGWSWEPSSSSILHARRRLCRLQISGFCRREVLPPVVVLIRGNADEEVQRCLRQSSRLFLHSRLDPGKFLLSFYVLIFRLCELQDPRFLPLVGPPSCGRAQPRKCGRGGAALFEPNQLVDYLFLHSRLYLGNFLLSFYLFIFISAF